MNNNVLYLLPVVYKLLSVPISTAVDIAVCARSLITLWQASFYSVQRPLCVQRALMFFLIGYVTVFETIR